MNPAHARRPTLEHLQDADMAGLRPSGWRGGAGDTAGGDLQPRPDLHGRGAEGGRG
ncbi:MAG: hypothetical protein WC277_12810 [Bacilli bacterium]